jgi:hypothetical protein
MSKTNYLENAIGNHILRNIAYASPALVYVGVFTAAPGEAGGGTEVAGNGYARKIATFGAPATPGVFANTNTITFDVATPGGWGTLTHFAIFDAVSGGNMLYYGSISVPKLIDVGDAAVYQPGQLIITED